MWYDGVIMIDLWEPRADQLSLVSWYESLAAHVQIKNVKCIVNACYMSAIDYVQDHSHYNTMRIYNKLGDNNGIHKDYCQNDQLLLNNLHNSRGLNKTSQVINQKLLNNNRSIFITNPEDFLHHWEHVLKKQVNNWLVIGQAWQICVHNRPIGLKHLSTLIKEFPLKFYGTHWGFVDENGGTITQKHFKKDSLPWTRIGHGIYELGYNK